MDIAEVGLRVDGNNAIRVLVQFDNAAERATRSGMRTERMANRLQGALIGLGAAFGIHEIVGYADSWTLVGARIDLVTKSTQQAAAVQHELFRVANETRNSFDSVASLYQRLAIVSDELGISQGDIINVVESVNNALLTSGATAVEAAQSIRQLGQALGSGVLQGDEFRTMMEAMPAVAKAVAAQMGVSTGELKELSKQNKITSDIVVQALLNTQKAHADAAKSIPITMGQGWTILQNYLTRFIGTASEATGIGNDVANMLVNIGRNLPTVVAGIMAAATALVAYYTAAFIAGNYTRAIATAQTVYAFFQLARSVRSVADAMALLKLVSNGVWGAIAAVAGATIGFIAYRKMLQQISAETALWQEGMESLNEEYGKQREVVDELSDAEAKRRARIAEQMEKQRFDNASRIREAQQALDLVGLEADEAERLSIQHDAINAALEARERLQGELNGVLDETLAAIEMERILREKALDKSIELKAIEEAKKQLDQMQSDLVRDLAESLSVLFGENNPLRGMFEALARELLTVWMKEFIEPAAAALLKIDLTKYGREKGAQEMLAGMSKKTGLLGIAAIAGGAGYTIGGMADTGTGGALSGMAAGALTGAAMGSIIPVVGTAIGAAVGGFTGAVGGFISASKKQAEEMRMHREVLHNNSERLQDLRESIDTLGAERVVGDKDMVMKAMNALSGNFLSDIPGTISSALNLAKIADEYGIQLTVNGKYVEGSLEQLKEAIDLTIRAMTQWGDNLTDIQKRQEAHNLLYGVEDTPEQAFRDIMEQLKIMAPALFEQMGLAGIDITTKAGREQALKAFQAIYELIVSGKLTPELLGAFEDKNQLIDTILAAAKSLQEFNKQLLNVTTDFPRAMDIMFYEQTYGRGTGGGTVEFGGGTAINTRPTDTNPWVPGGGFVVHGDVIIQTAPGDDGEEVLRQVEQAAQERARRGGFTYLPNTTVEIQ